jgi:Outer membrane protein beta-barrel domain
MSRFPAFLTRTALLMGLGLGTTKAAANPNDTIQVKLSDGATMTLYVRNPDELRKIRAYKMDSLMALLDRYITQAQTVSKAAGDAGRTTMEFYPARDLKNPNAPEKLRVVVYNDRDRPETSTRVDVGRAISVNVQESSDGRSATSVRISGAGVRVTDNADGTKNVRVGRDHELNEDSISELRRQRYDEDRTHGYMSLGFGLNALANSGNAQMVNPGSGDATVPVTLKTWGSRFVSLGYLADTRILKPVKSAPFVRYGFQFAFNNYMIDKNLQWVDDHDVTKLAAAPDGVQLQKSKLATSTLQLPVLLGFRLHNGKGKESISIAAGGFAGYRINSRTKLKYDQDGDTKKPKDHGSYNLQDFQYGLTGSVSVYGHEFFAMYNLNELFRDNRGPQGNVIAFGITLLGNESNFRSEKYGHPKRY